MQALIQVLAEQYNLAGTLTRLGGEVAENYRLDTYSDERYLVKIGGLDSCAEIALQQKMVATLKSALPELHLPVILPTLKGAPYVELPDDRLLRVQEWVPGRNLGEAKPRSAALLAAWGALAGRVSATLADVDFPMAHRKYAWDPGRLELTEAYDRYFEGEDRETLRYFRQLYVARFLPLQDKLRKSLNHNDLHEQNVLINEAGKITGFIDFGDAVFTQTINELAIVCAYAAMDLPDPLLAIVQVTAAYHGVFPLTEAELSVLFPLITARLVISVRVSAHNKRTQPDNAYLTVSEDAAWALLRQLRKLNPDYVEARLRIACGFALSQKSARYDAWLATYPQLASLVAWENQAVTALDLSVGSTTLGNNSEWNTPRAFDRRIARMLEDAGATIGVGGYAETRPFYTTDSYRVEGNQGAQWRTVHLGLDVWMQAGTPVYAPLDGYVHSVHDNAGDCDYGPTLILRHSPTAELTFYTLYGHLGNDVLTALQIGELVKQGQAIATIGDRPDNGGWPPHLHFQIMLDLWGNTVDFPGVGYPHEAATWLANCPNPHRWFPSLPITPPKFSGQLILQKRKKQIGYGLSLSYQAPLHIVRGYEAYLYAADGRRYLDTVNNVAHVGHEHAAVVMAGQAQMGVLNTNTRYLHPTVVEFAEALCATLPGSLSVVHFVNSGSEANELALRMARTVTGRTDTLALEVGYHGNTGGTIDVSSYKFDGKGGTGRPPGTHLLPLPDPFRGIHASDPALYASEAVATIERFREAPAAFIHESIISCGGQIVPPTGYFNQIYAALRARNVLCIADEVQTGLGRVGAHWWAFELHGITPDIVAIGKPLGNGHPVAAVVCTPEVARAFANGMEYFNTFGGNPVSCAIGRAVIDVVRKEGLRENATRVGNHLFARLLDLQAQFPLIADVRGHGLFLGFELMDGNRPAARQAAYLANRMRERGILMSTDGPDYNVLKIKPPMCFSTAQADELLRNLTIVFGEDAMRP